MKKLILIIFILVLVSVVMAAMIELEEEYEGETYKIKIKYLYDEETGEKSITEYETEIEEEANLIDVLKEMEEAKEFILTEGETEPNKPPKK